MMQEKNSEQFTDAKIKDFIDGNMRDLPFIKTLRETLPQEIDWDKTARIFKYVATNSSITLFANAVENFYYMAFIRGMQYGLEIDAFAPLAEQKKQLIKAKNAFKFIKESQPARARCIEIILSGWEKYAEYSKREANAFIRKELFEDAISKPYWMTIKCNKSKKDALFRDARKAAEKAKQ